jgi:uncharacterized peroxidase-related enzyme
MAAAIRLIEPSQNEFLAQLEQKSGRANRFFRTMANRPDVLQTFVPFYAAVMGRGPVDRRTKELVYLTVAFTNKCAYCSASHMASGKKAGISEDEIRALQGGQYDGFASAERAAILYARELTQTADGAGTRGALYEHFNDEQIVELTLVAAMANFTNRFNNGLDVEPEA